MSFYGNDPRTASVRWYFVPDGTPFVPYSNVFTSRVWDEDHIGWDGLGEVYGAVRTYDKGGSPPIVAQAGALPCGTPDQWANGQPLPPSAPVVIDALGNLAACTLGNPRMRPIAWWRGEDLVRGVPPTAVASWPDHSGNGYDLTALANGGFIIYDDASSWPRPVAQFSSLLSTFSLAKPLRLGQEFAIYWFGQQFDNFAPLWGNYLGNTKSADVQMYWDGYAMNYGDGAENIVLHHSPTNIRDDFIFQLRRTASEIRLQINGITQAENVFSNSQGPVFDILGFKATGTGYNGARVILGEVVVLPYAPDADEEAYWLSYMKGRWPFSPP